MGKKQSETERQHNRGQEDRSSGRDYRPPRDFLGGVFNSEASKAQRDASSTAGRTPRSKRSNLHSGRLPLTKLQQRHALRIRLSSTTDWRARRCPLRRAG